MCSLENIGDVYVLTLTGDGEHKLSPELLDAIKAALRRVRSEVTVGSKSSALITTAQGRFFSNGFDIDLAQVDRTRFQVLLSKLISVVIDLINMPLPTIAAVTGHTCASAFAIVLSHDYVLMRKDIGFLYASELDVGIGIPACFHALLRSKVGCPMVRRRVVLEAAKLTARDALEMGVIDSAHESAEETVTAGVKLGEELLRRKWNGEIYGQIRANMLADVLDSFVRFQERVVEGERRSTSKL